MSIATKQASENGVSAIGGYAFFVCKENSFTM